MNILYTTAQIIGWIGFAVVLISFQVKDTIRMILLQGLSGILMGTHYVMLGAPTAGAVQYLFAVNIALLSFRTEDWKSWRGWKWILSVAVIIITAFTWNGLLSIVPCICSITATLSNWTRNGKKIRLWRLFLISPLWIFYDILVHSYPGIVLEAVSELSILISIYRYGLKSLDQ